MAKHPTHQGSKQLFSLRYDNNGYCSLAITGAHNLEWFWRKGINALAKN